MLGTAGQKLEYGDPHRDVEVKHSPAKRAS
jgi:hypothetical protein